MISSSELDALDLTRFNDGVNPHGDNSVHAPIPADLRRKKLLDYGMSGHDRVLDLLCGFGGWAIFLAELNNAVWGLDKNEGAIRIAKGLSAHLGQTNTTFQSGDVSMTAEYPTDFFDAVWIWNALIYVERGPTLQYAHRALKPGGRIVIGAANATGRLLEKLRDGMLSRNPSLRNGARQARDCLWRGSHYDGCPNYFSARTVGPVLRKHGFEPIDVITEGKTVMGGFPRNLTLIARKI